MTRSSRLAIIAGTGTALATFHQANSGHSNLELLADPIEYIRMGIDPANVAQGPKNDFRLSDHIAPRNSPERSRIHLSAL